MLSINSLWALSQYIYLYAYGTLEKSKWVMIIYLIQHSWQNSDQTMFNSSLLWVLHASKESESFWKDCVQLQTGFVMISGNRNQWNCRRLRPLRGVFMYQCVCTELVYCCFVESPRKHWQFHGSILHISNTFVIHSLWPSHISSIIHEEFIIIIGKMDSGSIHCGSSDDRVPGETSRWDKNVIFNRVMSEFNIIDCSKYYEIRTLLHRVLYRADGEDECRYPVIYRQIWRWLTACSLL